MSIFTPPGFWDFIMDLDGDGVNDIEQGLALRKSQLNAPGSVATKSRSTRRAFTRAQIASVAPKKKRKVSAYQKRFGIEMKRLIKAHPRTPRTKLMARAHRATKKALK
jgi:hypothetical protein|tara:strand:+ start:165 stop:488 length:324 start_codon:yes stop_codon:yes gene_type:complete